MENIIKFLVDDLLTYIGGISVTALLAVGFYFLFKLASQHVFNKNIEKYKGQINEELESLKLQHQKNFKDFELYISKKHEKYPELFYQIETAFGQISSLRGYGRALTFQNVDEVDLRAYFEEISLTNFDKERIIQLWNNNRDSAIEAIRRLEPRAKYEIARQKWLEANNYQLYNILFFSDEVSHQSRVLLNNLFDYMDSLDPESPATQETNQENQVLENFALPNDRKNLNSIMRRELNSLKQ